MARPIIAGLYQAVSGQLAEGDAAGWTPLGGQGEGSYLTMTLRYPGGAMQIQGAQGVEGGEQRPFEVAWRRQQLQVHAGDREGMPLSGDRLRIAARIKGDKSVRVKEHGLDFLWWGRAVCLVSSHGFLSHGE
ncbi:hypothetical protein RY831_29450 [Noviherbaspirillum sp. CPCC 100848]|uniref:Uncharacterized protein n=1 Tax=Noviherbaspirillum album TaxID=3080276 RepID=A0ABU6JHY7_9BURK|nr:hypothetical protein [Noviherbaspirillum sp. CPCC 100848]